MACHERAPHISTNNEIEKVSGRSLPFALYRSAAGRSDFDRTLVRVWVSFYVFIEEENTRVLYVSIIYLFDWKRAAIATYGYFLMIRISYYLFYFEEFDWIEPKRERKEKQKHKYRNYLSVLGKRKREARRNVCNIPQNTWFFDFPYYFHSFHAFVVSRPIVYFLILSPLCRWWCKFCEKKGRQCTSGLTT